MTELQMWHAVVLYRLFMPVVSVLFL